MQNSPVIDLSSNNYLEMISQQMRAIANEIEFLPGQKQPEQEEEKIDLEALSPKIRLDSPKAHLAEQDVVTFAKNSLPAANKTETIQMECARQVSPLSMCYFKTRSNSLKMYELVLNGTHLIFNRPKSSKQSTISYQLRSFQCIIRNTT